MPIGYILKKDLKLYDNTKQDDLDIDTIVWYDQNNYFNESDYKIVENFNELYKLNDLIGLYIFNENEIDLNEIKNINIEQLRIENTDKITFCELNENIKSLVINYCCLVYAPVLPSNLVELDLSNNFIESLDEIELPESLIRLNLNDNHIKILNIESNTLETLYACNNYIMKIEKMSKNIKKIFLNNNYIDVKSNDLSPYNGILIM